MKYSFTVLMVEALTDKFYSEKIQRQTDFFIFDHASAFLEHALLDKTEINCSFVSFDVIMFAIIANLDE